MSENYKIYGKIISGLNKDYPSSVSRNFTDKVMQRIDLSRIETTQHKSNNYLNVAASILFAVVTSYILVQLDSSSDNLVSNEPTQPEQIKDNLIQKVIDKDDCKNNDKLQSKENVCK